MKFIDVVAVIGVIAFLVAAICIRYEKPVERIITKTCICIMLAVGVISVVSAVYNMN